MKGESFYWTCVFKNSVSTMREIYNKVSNSINLTPFDGTFPTMLVLIFSWLYAGDKWTNQVQHHICSPSCYGYSLICMLNVYVDLCRTIALMILFSQYMGNIKIPCMVYSRRRGFSWQYHPMLKMFPVSSINKIHQDCCIPGEPRYRVDNYIY